MMTNFTKCKRVIMVNRGAHNESIILTYGNDYCWKLVRKKDDNHLTICLTSLYYS